MFDDSSNAKCFTTNCGKGLLIKPNIYFLFLFLYSFCDYSQSIWLNGKLEENMILHMYKVDLIKEKIDLLEIDIGF